MSRSTTPLVLLLLLAVAASVVFLGGDRSSDPVTGAPASAPTEPNEVEAVADIEPLEADPADLTRSAIDDEAGAAARVRVAVDTVVRWHDGAPVMVARVSCVGEWPRSDTFAELAGFDGRARLEDLPPGRYRLVVDHADAVAPVSRPFTVVARDLQLEPVVLQRGLRIVGRAYIQTGVDGELRPRLAAGPFLRAIDDDGRLFVGEIGGDGRLRIKGLHPGTYTIVVWDRSMRIVRGGTAIAGTEDHELVMTTGQARVVGTITDTSGRRVPRFAVEVFERYHSLTVRRNRITGRAGEYVFRRIPPGEYRFEITAPGYEPLIVDPVLVGWTGERRQNGQLEPRPELVTRVVDPNGRAVVGARVDVYGVRGERPTLGDQTIAAMQSFGLAVAREGRRWVRLESFLRARTDAEGRVRLPYVANGRQLVVAASGFAMAMVDLDDGVPETLVLTEGQTVRGRVLRGGVPVSRTELYLTPAEIDDPRALTLFAVRDGVFVFDRVGPGTWFLLARDTKGRGIELARVTVTEKDVDLGEVALR